MPDVPHQRHSAPEPETRIARDEISVIHPAMDQVGANSIDQSPHAEHCLWTRHAAPHFERMHRDTPRGNTFGKRPGREEGEDFGLVRPALLYQLGKHVLRPAYI